jgi:hypothetical protein
MEKERKLKITLEIREPTIGDEILFIENSGTYPKDSPLRSQLNYVLRIRYDMGEGEQVIEKPISSVPSLEEDFNRNLRRFLVQGAVSKCINQWLDKIESEKKSL